MCRDFRHTAEDGKDYTTRFYNLDAIIAVGFRVNSARAIQFRQWARRDAYPNFRTACEGQARRLSYVAVWKLVNWPGSS